MIGHLPLEGDDLKQVEDSRDWVKGHFAKDADAKYEPLNGKLRLLGAILENDWVEPTETWKLQALGVTFGDALAQKLMLDWVVVDDEYGRSPALNWPGTALFSFPTTMISKRIERGEKVDVDALFEQACASLSDMAFSAKSI